MKRGIVGSVFVAISVCILSLAGPNTTSTDPCPNKEISSAELEVCYSRAQKVINTEADKLVDEIVAELMKKAREDQSRNEMVLADFERKTARSVRQSQISWRQYRERYCNAVMYSHDTGSDAFGTHEGCMFQMGEERIRQLQVDFAGQDGK